MRRVIVLMIALGMFVFAETAPAHTYMPNDHGKGKDSYFGLTGNHFKGPIAEFDFPFDNSSTSDPGYFEFMGIQMFSGVQSGRNLNSFKNYFRKDHSLKHIDKWYGGEYVGWSFWSFTFYSTLPTDEQWSMLFEERLELVLNTLSEYLDGRNGSTDPSPVPVPTPLLLLGSGLAGFVGFRRMYKN